MIYLITSMMISTVAMGLAPRLALVGRIAWSTVAVVAVSIVAGARDLDITPDMLLYGNGMFERISTTQNFDAARGVAEAEIQDPEVGYVWLNYFVSRLSQDPHVFYFFLAAVSATIIAVSIMLLRDFGPTWLMWLTYLCTSYLDSFNLLRQGPALALALLGTALVMRKRYISGAMAGLVGLLFHLTAVIFIPMFAAAVIIRRSKRPERLIFLVIAVTLAVAVGSSALLNLLGTALSDTKYVYYLEETQHGGIALGFETLYRLIPLALSAAIIINDLRRRGNALSPEHASSDSMTTISAAHQSQVRALSRQRPVKSSTPSPMPAISVLFALTALLAVELLILPIRELAFGLYRVPMYFGFTRILSYGVIVGSVTNRGTLARVLATVFVVGYFIFMVLGRTGIEYRTEILDSWFLS